MTSVSSKISLENHPKLSHDPASSAPWRKSIEVYLQIGDVYNIVTGNDTEPGRVGVRPTDVRAGSVPPMTPVEGQTIGRRITGEEWKEWEKWQARENQAQGMIKGTVSDAVMLDISEKMSAKEMWDYCIALHVTATIENQRNVHQALFSYDLRDDATAKEMAKHVEDFSKTMSKAKLVGLKFDSQERAGLFLNTILAPSYRIIQIEVTSLIEVERTWENVTAVEQLLSIDRRLTNLG
ncbi:hypothetical protein M231_05687 [Tremella mesenterica]|uniref:Uncharacterized protein n=1 Tax=Tremella mesenterica TaxID=5217 RepID=A0A4Q1BHF0_TREME|nr:hypothetical protein M231_05687 [Tremella mesenterica]